MSEITIDLEFVENNPQAYFNQRLPLHKDGITLLPSVSSVVWLKAEDNYTRLMLMGIAEQQLSTKNLGYYEKILPASNFLRIHNSHIINVSHIRSIIRSPHWEVLLEDGTYLEVSDKKKELLLKLLGLKIAG